VDTHDRVGLAIYNGADTGGYLENGLTQDFELLADIVQHRQAGHYHSYTNIGGGLTAAREELEDNGRPTAFKMVVLMTDGIANWANGSYSLDAGRQHAIDEAQGIADLNYPIITVSLGAGADTALMQQIADMTPEGRHFNVPGGQTGQQYYDDLVEVFREIAKDRPLKLVK
jgi:Mg-chelatase subunit ChlD